MELSLEKEQYGSLEVVGRVENQSDERIGMLVIHFNIYDRAGNKIDDVSDMVQNLEAGKVWKFRARINRSGAVKAKFAKFEIL